MSAADKPASAVAADLTRIESRWRKRVKCTSASVDFSGMWEAMRDESSNVSLITLQCRSVTFCTRLIPIACNTKYAAAMATICEARSGREMPVRSRTLLGRSVRADVKLSSMGASSEHALICWDGEDWSLRDLKSRNGTWINNAPLTGRTWRLAPGDRLAFGDSDECWIWMDGTAPRAAAVCVNGYRVEAAEHLLCLPDNDVPQALVYLGESGWLIEREGQTLPLKDRDFVTVGGLEFRMELPELDARAGRTRTVVSSRDIRAARAMFSVSSDEEHVELTLQIANEARLLPAHAYFYMLLILARARRADLASGVREDDAGWVYVDDLTSQLATDTTKLNVDVCRARKLVDELGWFSNPEELIQRRKGTKQLRFGCALVEVSGTSGFTR